MELPLFSCFLFLNRRPSVTPLSFALKHELKYGSLFLTVGLISLRVWEVEQLKISLCAALFWLIFHFVITETKHPYVFEMTALQSYLVENIALVAIFYYKISNLCIISEHSFSKKACMYLKCDSGIWFYTSSISPGLLSCSAIMAYILCAAFLKRFLHLQRIICVKFRSALWSPYAFPSAP